MEELPKSHCYLTYDEVINKAQLIQPNFEADLPQFTGYDPWFTLAVNTQLLAGINLGLKDFSVNGLTDEIKRTIDLLNRKLAVARHCYEKLSYYVDVGLKDTAIATEIFGYLGFVRARGSAKKMIPLLNQAHEAIEREGNESRLLAAGMPHGLPLELVNITAELSSIYGELKTIKKQQLQVTRERIELFNSIWDILSKICDDAKNIFSNDPARLAIYELYDTEDLDSNKVELEHFE
jgi:hypothetical protein